MNTNVTKRFSLGIRKSKMANESATVRRLHVGDGKEAENTPFNFASNKVFTTKYNVITFLPKFFREQFSKYSNFFFLIIALLQISFPSITPTNSGATLMGLSTVLIMSAIKELYEDSKRRRADVTANNARALIFDFKTRRFIKKKWADIKVGNIVRVSRGQQLPADVIIVNGSEPEGLAFVETANIDGETNLKIRQAPRALQEYNDVASLMSLSGILTCEVPSEKIYSFEGKFVPSGQSAIALGPEQLLIRGSVLQNTEWVFGIVVYTGPETKIMKNSREKPMKLTKMEHYCNRQMIFVFLILILIAIMCTVFSMNVEHNKFRDLWGLKQDGSEFINYLYRFFTFILLFHNLVPINLLMTMEIVRLKLAQLISCDMQIYDPETDSPTVVKTSTIIEELGQVEYVLSDKTGTLTCNMMELKHFVAGEKVVHNCLLSDNRMDSPDRAHEDMMRAMSLCHTVLIEKGTNPPIYQASSPDEAAIVEACRDMKYTFLERTHDTVTLEFPNGAQEKWKILALIEFTSARKRMSVLYEAVESAAYASGDIVLFTKGADSAIFERLGAQRDTLEATTTALEGFAKEGMRTLCFAMLKLDRAQAVEWLNEWEEALVTVNDRQSQMDKVSEKIETDLELVGATAVEDKLQEGVPETIAILRDAGIKVWVLTGDRKETAVNIGYSCCLLTESMKIITLDSDNVSDMKKQIEEGLKSQAYCEERKIETALIVGGPCLDYALEADKHSFAKLSTGCTAVLCCRCSPLQKALIAELVKTNGTERKITLAIGDGANDVGMIQAAHIGVGISGKEGLQAAQSADFSIAQFKFLQRLILVHGSWSYHRLSKVVQFCMYKNMCLYLGQLWFSIYNGFSGQSLYDSYTLSFYNIFFTFWPIVFVGIGDQYVSAEKLIVHPKLYQLGIHNRFFNRRTFWTNALNGLWHSFVAFFVTVHSLSDSVVNMAGHPVSLWFMSSCIFAGILNTVTHKTFLISNYWTFLVFMATYGSMSMWFVYTTIVDTTAEILKKPAAISGMSVYLYSSPKFWLLFFLIPVVALLRDYMWRFYQRWYRPSSYHIIQEIQRMERKGLIQPPAIKDSSLERQETRNRGFSFSQSEGQEKVLEAVD